MSEFIVESNIPIPSKIKEYKYPYEKMDVGDSFFVPCESKDLKSKRNTMWASASYRKKEYGHNYYVKIVDGGIRVWRTK